MRCVTRHEPPDPAAFTALDPNGFGPGALEAMLTARQLTRDELRAWASEVFDLLLSTIDATLSNVSVVEERPRGPRARAPPR